MNYCSRKSKIALLIGLLAWSQSIFVFSADTATQPLKKSSSPTAPSQVAISPYSMAYEGGFFRKYGLDVQPTCGSGSRTVQTLISGDVVAAQVAGTSIIQSNLQGAAVVMIGGFLNTMDYKFMVAHDITRPDQLRGKVVAVSRIGSLLTSQLVTR